MRKRGRSNVCVRKRIDNERERKVNPEIKMELKVILLKSLHVYNWKWDKEKKKINENVTMRRTEKRQESSKKKKKNRKWLKERFFTGRKVRNKKIQKLKIK